MLTKEQIIQLVQRLAFPVALLLIACLAALTFDAYDKRHVAVQRQEAQAREAVRIASIELSQARIRATSDKQKIDFNLAQNQLDAVRNQPSTSSRLREDFQALRDEIFQPCSHNLKLDFRCVNAHKAILTILSQNR